MKVKKVENYDAGYSRTNLLKKGVLAVTAASLICGGLASCGNQLVGDVVEYYPEEYDGGMTCVSSDEVSSDEISCDSESDEEIIYGDMVCVDEGSTD